MSDEVEFLSFLLEEYAEAKHSTAPEILKIWESTHLPNGWTLTEYILKNYFIYHMEAIENAFKDIDHIIEHGIPLY